MNTYFINAIPESGLINAEGKAEAREKAFNFFQACYGREYNILSIVDVTDRKIIDKEKQYLT